MPRETPWTRCTAQKEKGDFCDALTIPGAPFPICIRHAAQIFGFLSEHISAADRNTITEGFLDILRIRESDAAPWTAREDGTIYYLQVGDMVKIGTTVNLPSRLKTYPPNRLLLATEPGGHRLEQQRHRMFRADCIQGEWFRPSAELLAHMESIRREYGAPDRVA